MRNTTFVSARAARARAIAAAVVGNAELARLVTLAVSRTHAQHAALNMMTDRSVTVSTSSAELLPTGAETEFDQSYCVHVLTSDAPLSIPDGTRDPRVADTEAAQQGSVRSYLGIPVRTRDGQLVGVLCVYGPDPRPWTTDEQRALTELAAQASTIIDNSAISAAS